MRIQFLGAVRNVTGSRHRLQIAGKTILLDCGLFQGRRRDFFDRNQRFEFGPTRVDMVLLSHAHIDHSGNIPTLVRQGFAGHIYATPATVDLCSAMLRDSAHVLAADAAYVNKKRARKGEPPVKPLYSLDDALEAVEQFLGVGYNRPIPLTDGATATFRDAGHILGSAMIEIAVRKNGHNQKVVYSGDLGRPNLPILRDPYVVQDVDTLILESTYGDRTHDSPPEAEDQLRRVILETVNRGGKIIIPAFAVGRTQELVYALHRLTLARQIPELPVFVDSPLAVNVTEIFRLHPECYDREINAFMERADVEDAFGFRRLRYVRDVEESKALNSLEQPAVIISASGMCEAGRILHHLKNNIEDPRNTILFVGFQAEQTLGRKLVDGWKKVNIFGEEYTVRAAVERIDGYSAHADRNELLDYVRRVRQTGLRRVFIVHGEEAASLSLAAALKEMGVPEVHVPMPGDTVEL
ncbi:MAG: MBL fold metallo-hydrolase [Chloroflexi bacterium]|nr:MBL fold metallo-hydrolase [Chloroflexota bacterium]